MNGSTDRPRVPGTTLLKIGRVLFTEPMFSAAVEPTISDLQREVAEAGPSRVKRRRAQWRGYCAFWKLTLVAPFASWPSPARDDGAVGFPDAVSRLAVGSIGLTVLVIAGRMPVAGVAGVAVAGALFAAVIHAWNQRHPDNIPPPAEPPRRIPQINFSSTEVDGNVGGLIFVVGSVFIVAIGLPSVIWFLCAGTVAGCVVAWGLVAWHRNHPQNGLPSNRIV